ncbi:MAG TPA: SDR family oxidoreductase [Dehalococcoidia bacterium]|jgi:NAD(P)-dependent dehydrogenase (short-subunit alcohol dehydrogenase family)|nr:short-chain dehydrogenase [Chloroflexota bacterium]MDP7161547.1 SDR family oxidoreductase [Dehalococcoidia bacterium]MDP7213244.1 SDR family oxidoreductase [Dehalococcoidia bacterium]HJM54359.1 SDR family oxidoreductase [Dehalococcoidia bacterium]|tara:strand:- start:275 stop:1018 length:744 start_codon:yes stop_codon:yes gene_type:complete
MGKLDGKVAVITGGGTGIGKAIGKAFAEQGCDLVLAARNAERLDESATEIAELGVRTLAVPTDVAIESDVMTLFERAMAEFGRVDLLVNNAGVIAGDPIDKLTLEKWRQTFSVNVDGLMMCTREAFIIMKSQGGGRIINIGSVASDRPRDWSAPYTSSKHAVTGLTKSTALDGREYGISCGQLNPGNTWVERRADGRSASGKDMGAEPMVETVDMANAAVFMATLPPEANVLEMTVIPNTMVYIGRG